MYRLLDSMKTSAHCIVLVCFFQSVFCESFELANDVSEMHLILKEHTKQLSVVKQEMEIMKGELFQQRTINMNLREDLEEDKTLIQLQRDETIRLEATISEITNRCNHGPMDDDNLKNDQKDVNIHSIEDMAPGNGFEKRLLVPETTPLPRPPVVAFSAFMSKDETHVVDHHNIIFDTVQVNEGNGYNHHTGSFVAPFAGVYVFQYTLVISSNKEVCTDLVINDSIQGHVLSYTGTLNVQQTGSSIVVHRLNQGDTVFVRTGIDGGCGQTGTIFGDNWRRSTFAGWLIG